MASNQDKLLSGICPDDHCQAKLFFPQYDASIECTHCGQRHERVHIKNVDEVSDPEIIIKSMIRSILLSNVVPKRGPDMVLVNGLSNYHCKLLSPLLTEYGMDKASGQAKLLREMSQSDMFDCGILHDRSFRIDPEHLNIAGYGLDVSGSLNYLSDTLDHIKLFNDGEQRLIPIHADGDGHCLVHAISRALVGRELFWHPLRCNLKKHLQKNLQRYQTLFKDFVDDREWQTIIEECDPHFIPPDGELLGLRNIHIFGLANVLKRPIILLDSVKGMMSLGDYSALFLPVLVDPSDCRGKDLTLNRPLCLAWSSSGRNHYIPLVGLKTAPLPRLHRSLVPKAWGTAQGLVDSYLDFDPNGFCFIGGERVLGDTYLLRLVTAMDKVFLAQHGVHPRLVADVHHYVYRRIGVVGAHPQQVVCATKKAVEEKRLYRCLICDAVCEQHLQRAWFQKDGILYKLAKQNHGQLLQNKRYDFPMHSVTCTYNVITDELIPESGLEKCTWCTSSKLRLLHGDGTILYENGDQTKTPSFSTRCNCGFKHFWNGLEYDNLPQEFNVKLDWNKKVVIAPVAWFQNETQLTLNSNAYQIATELVHKHFPGEFGSETLIKSIVDQIFEKTKAPESIDNDCPDTVNQSSEEFVPDKIIMPGPKLIHKEELGASRMEKQLQQRVSFLAPQQQKRQTIEQLGNVGSSKPKAIKSSSPDPEETKKTIKPVKEISLTTPFQFIKVATSDGRMKSYQLDGFPPTFQQLQQWIENEFNIPSCSQHLKYGFPLKDLIFTSQSPLPLKHGDRVLVEVVQDSQGIVESFVKSISTDISSQEQLLLVGSLLMGKTLWEYAQMNSYLFEKGGFFYSKVEESSGLQDGKHYKIHGLPDKIFRYNQQLDILELCMEPYGHFPVGPGVEENTFNKMKVKCSDDDTTTESGATITELSDMPEPPKPKTEPVLVRKGPGFSVLAPPHNPAPQPNPAPQLLNSAEQLRDFISKISDLESSLAEAPMESTEENCSNDANKVIVKSERMDTV